MSRWAVEVQHASDVDLDGKWYELEVARDEAHADFLLDYFGVEKPKPPGIRPESCVITGSYAGRPLRKRELIDEA